MALGMIGPTRGRLIYCRQPAPLHRVPPHPQDRSVSAAPMRCGFAVSLTAQTGQSEAIHSPEECARIVVRLTIPAV